MDITSRQLLYLLSVAMETKTNSPKDTRLIDYDRLFYLSGIHNVIPMIYQALSKKQLITEIKPELAKAWRRLSVGYYVDQLRRTKEFLDVYDRLNHAGICALVVKGVILRQLYPEGEYRYSGDEDIYIRIRDFPKVDSILTSVGLRKVNNAGKGKLRQETVYENDKTGLRIEVHIELFDPTITLFREMNQRFEQAFEHCSRTIIDGITLFTLSAEEHLLFLLLHSAKHFITMGFGIRQVCDLVEFCNTFGSEIDFTVVWKQVISLGYGVFMLNLFKIGSRYLGLEEEKLSYPSCFVEKDIHMEALLEDILHAGVFGKSDEDQTRTCSLTLQAVMADRNHALKKYHKLQLIKILFPGQEFMNNHFFYCRSRFLLPIAWLHRMVTYAIKIKNPIGMMCKAKRSIEIGRKRVALLEEYKMIGT